MDRQEQMQLMARLRQDAQQLAVQFGLRFRSVEPERANVKRRYGVCYSDGEIRIRLRHATSGRPLKYSSLVNTLCHELAHLRHFNHGERFKLFYQEILAFARRMGIYQPGPASRSDALPRTAAARSVVQANAKTAGPRGPEQLGLFG